MEATLPSQKLKLNGSTRSSRGDGVPSYCAEVFDVIAGRRLSANSDVEVFRPLVVGAVHLQADDPVLQQSPEVRLPVGLYRGCVQVSLGRVEDVLELVGLPVGLDKLRCFQPEVQQTGERKSRAKNGRVEKSNAEDVGERLPEASL